MCTSMALKTRDFYFGRNMDIEHGFGGRVVVTPRNFPFSFRKCGEMRAHYAMIGVAAVRDGYPLYAEAVNEKGLGVAGLSFPENACYPSEETRGKDNVSPFELIPWLLGQCGSTVEARKKINEMHLVGIPFSEALPLSPLHWHIADREESIVLEPVKEGLRIYDNPAGVMTNNPPFDFHMENLNQYLNLTVDYPKNRFHPKAGLKPFGVGMGAVGLPGDFSPASRFVRETFLRFNSISGEDELESVTRYFHLMDAVSMPDGIVMTREGRFEKTEYTCCVNADKGIFYYKTYENNQITAVDMHRENLDGNALTEYSLVKTQQIHWIN